jgi:hypothetical protein
MIAVTNEQFDSSRWGETFPMSREERSTAIRGLEVARHWLLLIHNTTPTWEGDGHPTFNIRLLADIDRLIDRLKHAEIVPNVT